MKALGGAHGAAPLLNEAAMDRVTLQTRNGRWERKEGRKRGKWTNICIAEWPRARGRGEEGGMVAVCNINALALLHNAGRSRDVIEAVFTMSKVRRSSFSFILLPFESSLPCSNTF